MLVTTANSYFCDEVVRIPATILGLKGSLGKRILLTSRSPNVPSSPSMVVVFHTRTGTPLNPGNVLNRYVRPTAQGLGIPLSGWHDFRHTLSTNLRRAGTHPKVIADILGHEKVNLAMDVYDRTDVKDFAQPLSLVASELKLNPIEPTGTRK